MLNLYLFKRGREIGEGASPPSLFNSPLQPSISVFYTGISGWRGAGVRYRLSTKCNQYLINIYRYYIFLL
jgi:hypothetical protein